MAGSKTMTWQAGSALVTIAEVGRLAEVLAGVRRTAPQGGGRVAPRARGPAFRPGPSVLAERPHGGAVHRRALAACRRDQQVVLVESLV